MAWTTVSRWIGGVYQAGRYVLIIHDDGVDLAKDQIVVWEWPKRSA